MTVIHIICNILSTKHVVYTSMCCISEYWESEREGEKIHYVRIGCSV